MGIAVNGDGDTIAALSTPMGRGGIAVIRVSGEGTRAILSRMVEGLPGFLEPRRAYHGFVTDGKKHIDECVVVFFKGPSSYTGEDVAEISIHSNPFIVEEVLNLVLKQDLTGETVVRNALPGEFTYRAFRNGKLDLIQAESVNELINANSRYYAHMKFGSLEGRLSRFMEELKEALIDLGVLIETKIEFEEDQFFDEIAVSDQLKGSVKRLDTLLGNARFNDLLNKGLNVVIAGKVNVGKSSLFNMLLMEERSIISSTPGTTRDFIREKLYIDGFPVDITDVAGINRETEDHIEVLGIQRSIEKLENCDAVIFMLDVSRPVESMDRDIYELVKGKRRLIIGNKADIGDPVVWDSIRDVFGGEEIVEVSVKDHRNIGVVTGFLEGLVGDIRGREAEFTVNRRQRGLLEELRGVLVSACGMVEGGVVQVELAAEEIRGAIGIIGRLMGEVTPDDILNKIFSQFCVGK